MSALAEMRHSRMVANEEGALLDLSSVGIAVLHEDHFVFGTLHEIMRYQNQDLGAKVKPLGDYAAHEHFYGHDQLFSQSNLFQLRAWKARNRDLFDDRK
jgi:hypothetical protein